MPSCDFIKAALTKHGLSFFECVIHICYPTAHNCRRRTSSYAPKMSGISKIFGHLRISNPLTEYRVGQNRTNRICQDALGFASHRGSCTGHFASCGQARTGQPIRSLLHFLQKSQTRQSTSNIAPPHASTVEFHVDLFGIWVLVLMATEAPSDWIALPCCYQK